MSWRRGELWLDSELWVPEPVRASTGFALPTFPREAPPGLDESRRRREVRARGRHARRSRVSAMALSPAVALALAALQADGRQRGTGIAKDPPSLTFRFDNGVVKVLEKSAPVPKHVRRTPKAAAEPKIEWHHATSVGLPYGGRLVNGTQLPLHGPDWVTWNPITDSSPNLPYRLYGNQHTISEIVTVTHAYRHAHPHAPLVVIGDISFTHGGPMDDHLSHQNGLDVDVYYPRRDHELRAPTTHDQIDFRLAQDLLDGFLAAGAQHIFVGATTGLRGPADIVQPWPDHDYHMHVRFPPPTG